MYTKSGLHNEAICAPQLVHGTWVSSQGLPIAAVPAYVTGNHHHGICRGSRGHGCGVTVLAGRLCEEYTRHVRNAVLSMICIPKQFEFWTAVSLKPDVRVTLPTPVSPKCSTGVVDFPVQFYILVKQVLTTCILYMLALAAQLG